RCRALVAAGFTPAFYRCRGWLCLSPQLSGSTAQPYPQAVLRLRWQRLPVVFQVLPRKLPIIIPNEQGQERDAQKCGIGEAKGAVSGRRFGTLRNECHRMLLVFGTRRAEPIRIEPLGITVNRRVFIVEI